MRECTSAVNRIPYTVICTVYRNRSKSVSDVARGKCKYNVKLFSGCVDYNNNTMYINEKRRVGSTVYLCKGGLQGALESVGQFFHPFFHFDPMIICAAINHLVLVTTRRFCFFVLGPTVVFCSTSADCGIYANLGSARSIPHH